MEKNKARGRDQQALPPRKRIRKQKEFLVSAFFCICIVLILAMGVMKIRTHRIDGNSMQPTLQNNDRVVIWKTQEPERYDLVAFEPQQSDDPSYIKRIVGLPGDTIWVEGNALYINHQMDAADIQKGITAKELPDGTLKVTITENVWNDLEHLDTIPAGCYFVLGDNRKHSTDSRHFGFVQKEQIEGVAVLRYYPFSQVGIIN